MYDNIEFVIACGGQSTRNFPHAKGLAHKCLMPFGDIRLIDYVLKEITDIGGRHITFVCSDEDTINTFKKALMRDEKTETKLRNKGKVVIADILKDTFLPEDIDLKFVIQEKPLGTSQVVGLAHRVSPERDAVLFFPDDIIVSAKKQDSHLKRMLDAFLKDKNQILLTGIYKEDVSNNAILHNKRLIEKPKNPTSHIGGYSPIIFPKACLDFIETETTKIEQTGQMPNNLSVGEWVYVDGINSFLDTQPEDTPYQIKMFMKSDDDFLLDTGVLPLYEQAQLFTLLVHSRFKEQNQALVRKLLDGNLSNIW